MRSLINPFSVLRHVNLWDVAVFDVGGDTGPDGDPDVTEGMIANTQDTTATKDAPAPTGPTAPDGGAVAAEIAADTPTSAESASTAGFGNASAGEFGGTPSVSGPAPDASLGPDPGISYGDPGMDPVSAPDTIDSINSIAAGDPGASMIDSVGTPSVSVDTIDAIDSIAAGDPGTVIDTVGTIAAPNYGPPGTTTPGGPPGTGTVAVAPPAQTISQQIADNAKAGTGTTTKTQGTFTPPTARSVMSTAREIAASKANQDRKDGPLSASQIAANLTNATNFDGKWGYTTWDGKTVTKGTDKTDGGGVDIAGAGFARSGGRAADKNNDGFVTAAEAKAAGGLKGNFASSISNSIGATPLGSGLPTTGLASMVPSMGLLPSIGMAAYNSRKEKTDYFGRGKTAPPTSLNAEGMVEAPQYGSYTSMGFGNSGQGTTGNSFEQGLSVAGGPDSEDPVKLEPTAPGPVCPEGYEYDQEKNMCVIDPFKEPFPETPTVPTVPPGPTGPTSPYTAAQPVGLSALLPTNQSAFVVPTPNVQPITVGTQQSGIMNPLIQQVQAQPTQQFAFNPMLT